MTDYLKNKWKTFTTEQEFFKPDFKRPARRIKKVNPAKPSRMQLLFNRALYRTADARYGVSDPNNYNKVIGVFNTRDEAYLAYVKWYKNRNQ